MKIVITGVPGTGKSTLARLLAKKLKCELLRVNEVVVKKKLYTRVDEDGAKVVKMRALFEELAKKSGKKKNLVIEGHLACEFKLPAELVIVCRCNPKVLEKRLVKRKYASVKKSANTMSEMLDYCTILACKNYGEANVFEVDGGLKKEEMLKSALEIVKKKPKEKKAGWVDWSKILFESL
ncbi:MAG: AAA family ATPase [Candidatus Micrarchaeota archaeon]